MKVLSFNQTTWHTRMSASHSPILKDTKQPPPPSNMMPLSLWSCRIVNSKALFSLNAKK